MILGGFGIGTPLLTILEVMTNNINLKLIST